MFSHNKNQMPELKIHKYYIYQSVAIPLHLAGVKIQHHNQQIYENIHVDLTCTIPTNLIKLDLDTHVQVNTFNNPTQKRVFLQL